MIVFSSDLSSRITLLLFLAWQCFGPLFFPIFEIRNSLDIERADKY